MKISEHYLGYAKKTLIVVTNNEVAKIYAAKDKEVEEINSLEVKPDASTERTNGTPNSGPQDFDEIKKHSRLELYSNLSKRLQKYIKNGYEEIVLCVPEAYKNEISDSMHPDVMNVISEVVPKNLASLELDQIIRILQEKKPIV